MKMICINCPRGCELDVEKASDGIVTVTGNACPRGVLEIRDKGKNHRRVYVACNNKEKGAVAKKNCSSACIGCGKCAKVCPFEAITVENNLAYIDYHKCKACRKCVDECPSGAILTVGFPPKKEAPKPETVAEPVAEPAQA